MLIAFALASLLSQPAQTSTAAAVPAPVIQVTAEVAAPAITAAAEDETLTAMEALYTSVLSHIKLAGFVQGRFEWHGDAEDGLNARNKPQQTTQFLVRYGRLKTTVTYDLAEMSLEIDATPKGVSVKEAEASLIEPWSGYDMKLTVGQFKVPFGYDVLQPVRERQMAERTIVTKALFPGEYDRGLRFKAGFGKLKLVAAVINGNGSEDALYPGVEQNAFKDVVGRVGFDAKFLVLGLSGYYGKFLDTTAGNASATPAVLPTWTEYTKSRVGFDAQTYVEDPLGKLALKGEVIFGREEGADALGFWAMVSQGLGKDVNVFGRFEWYDGDLDAADDAHTLIGGGAEYWFNEHLRLNASYEHRMEPEDEMDDAFIAHLQAQF